MEILYKLNIYLMPLITIILYYSISDKYRKSYWWHFSLLISTVLYAVLLNFGIYNFTKYLLIPIQIFFLGFGASFTLINRFSDENDKRKKIPYIYNFSVGILYWFISSAVLMNYKFDFIEYLYNSKLLFNLLDFTFTQDNILITLTPFVNYLVVFTFIYGLSLAIYSFINFILKKEISFKLQFIILLPALVASTTIFLLL